MTILLGLALALSGVPGACAGPDTPERAVEIEYRQIGLGRSCIGNWRVRVTPAGELFHARNTAECEGEEIWSAPMPATPTASLDASEVAALAAWVRTSGLLELDPVVTDPRRATSDGSKEEVEIVLDGQRRTIEVINTRVDAVVALRQRLLGLMRGR